MNTNLVFYNFGRMFERVHNAAILLVHTKKTDGYGKPLYAFDLNTLHLRYKEFNDYVQSIKDEVGWIEETEEIQEVKNRIMIEMRALNEFLEDNEMGFTL